MNLSDLPAFPGLTGHFTDKDLHNQIISGGVTYAPGMTLLQYYAGESLKGILSNPTFFEDTVVEGLVEKFGLDYPAIIAINYAKSMIRTLETTI